MRSDASRRYLFQPLSLRPFATWCTLLSVLLVLIGEHVTIPQELPQVSQAPGGSQSLLPGFPPAQQWPEWLQKAPGPAEQTPVVPVVPWPAGCDDLLRPMSEPTGTTWPELRPGETVWSRGWGNYNAHSELRSGDTTYEAGNYHDALVQWQRALQAYRSLGNDEGVALALQRIGEMHELLGDSAAALAFLQQARQVYGTLRDKQGESLALLKLGWVHRRLQEYARARELFQHALTLARELGNRQRQGEVLLNIGWVHEQLRQYVTAQDFFQQTLDIAREFDDRRLEREALRALGWLRHDQGEDTAALEFYWQAMAISGATDSPEALWRLHFESAQVLQNLGRATEALRHYMSAVDVMESVRGGLQSPEFKVGFLESRLVVYRSLVTLLLALHEQAPTQGYAAQAFHYAERSKARAFLDQLAAGHASVRRRLNPTVQWAEASLREREHRLYQLLAQAHTQAEKLWAAPEGHGWQQRVIALEGCLAALQQQASPEPLRLADLTAPPLLAVADVQTALLQEGDVLLEYAWGTQGLHLFIIDRTHINTLTLRVEEHVLTEMITRLLASLRPPRLPQDVRELVATLQQFDWHLAHTLYQQLVHPATPYLDGAKTLVIVPDGVLHYLPFGLLLTHPYTPPVRAADRLPDARDAPYLIRRYPMGYSPSASVVRQARLRSVPQSIPRPQTLLALAPFGEEGDGNTAPPPSPGALQKITTWVQQVWGWTRDLEHTRQETGKPLPFTRREVQQIGDVFRPHAHILLSQQATKQALTQVLWTWAQDYRYVHLATHALVNEVQPMFSGLVFADGEVLQTFEIFHLELRAELVVLSACETGLGALRGGEGLVGLTRAFMYAGTPSIVASLWRVNDASTAALMTAFYQQLHHGTRKADALQQAQLRVIQQYPHPYFWAPFVLLGEWQ